MFLYLSWILKELWYILQGDLSRGILAGGLTLNHYYGVTGVERPKAN